MAFINITPDFSVATGVSGLSLTHVSTTAQLGDFTYRLDYYTNKADNGWYMDISAQDGTPLVIGIGLVAGIDLLYPYRYLNVPPGKIFVSPQGPDGYVDPTLDAFINGYATIYYEEPS